MATTAAVKAFRRVYADPTAGRRTQETDDRLAAYSLLWAYYENSAFEQIAQWAAYRQQYHLYRQIRPIYNPARRLVNFYSGVVYQGDWSTDPKEMIAKTAAIPWSEKTRPELLGAIGQLYQWANWQSKHKLMLRYGAALGDVLIAVVDDPTRRKVYPEILWPGWVTEIEVDAAGNVQRYEIEYDVAELDEDGEPTDRLYTYGREVTKELIRTYYNGSPQGYGDQPAEYPNPYGFVPAAWTQHTLTGLEHGQPALRSIGKVDELNALGAHARDQIHRILSAPVLIAGNNIAISEKSKAPATTDAASREEQVYITAAAGSSIETATVDPGETLAHMDRMITEIEADHPELSMYAKLREMSQVTGPAADRLFGDVAGLVNEARAQYDQQTIKLMQMCAAIAGWRANSGAWGLGSQLTNQQRVFLPFDLDSYAAGDLDLSIRSRGLTIPTIEEELRIQQMQNSVQADQQYRAAVNSNAPANVADRIRQAAQGQGTGQTANPQPQPQQGRNNA